MEMLLKDGLVKNYNNKKTLEFFETNEMIEEQFVRSFNNVIRLIDGYDIAKSSLNKEKDVFYLYSFQIKYDDIEKTLKEAFSGYTKNIVNNDNTNVLSSIKDDNQNGIFWDVKNDLIIVIGLDNLKTLLLQLERKRWECIKIQNEEFMHEYMELCASGVYKKVMKKS